MLLVLPTVTGRASCSPPHRNERAATRTGKSRSPLVHWCHVALQVLSAEHWATWPGSAMFLHVISGTCIAAPSLHPAESSSATRALQVPPWTQRKSSSAASSCPCCSPRHQQCMTPSLNHTLCLPCCCSTFKWSTCGPRTAPSQTSGASQNLSNISLLRLGALPPLRASGTRCRESQVRPYMPPGLLQRSAWPAIAP